MLDLFYLVILLPLLGFLHNGLLQTKISKRITGTIGTLVIFIPFLITLGAFQEFNPMERKDPFLFTILPWMEFAGFSVGFSYQVDQLSIYMTLIITGIGSLIHIYSYGYMQKEEGFQRFFAYLNLFVFSMLNLVLADNLVLTFLGWEGVGLCSYLLIGFEYRKPEAASAGMKAFVVNRIGDVGFIIGMGLIYWYTGSLKYTEILATLPHLIGIQLELNTIALVFFVAAVGKSAQIPLFVWLPDAMAGPTPVSALIHAATMVTAGVFLIARLNLIYWSAEFASSVIAWIGVSTAFLGAILALLQSDIKKVLAYSTVSQLGYMFLAMGLGAYTAGMFHLMTHAFFKALLFLGAGSVIYALHHEQNIWKMGSLAGKLKLTFLCFLIGCFAILGIPPFSGFFSKDLILEKAFSHPNFGFAFWGLGLLTALLTSFYMVRLLTLVFFGKDRTGHHSTEAAHHSEVHEPPFSMGFVLVLLAIGSATVGFLQTPFYFGEQNLLQDYFAPIFANGQISREVWGGTGPRLSKITHETEIILVTGTLFSILATGFVSFLVYRKAVSEPDYTNWKKVVFRKLYIDEFYELIFVKTYQKISSFIAFQLDQKAIDRGFTQAGLGFGVFSGFLRKIQTGFVGDYALYIVIGSISVLIFIMMKGVS
jgi:NADH-quinone oxidoreductase subunit L